MDLNIFRLFVFNYNTIKQVLHGIQLDHDPHVWFSYGIRPNKVIFSGPPAWSIFAK